MTMRDVQLFKLSAWALPSHSTNLGPGAGWSNKDMDPVPPHLRTWTVWNYIAYWIADSTNIPVWQLASSMLVVGLTWWVRCICSLLVVSSLPPIGDKRWLLSLSVILLLRCATLTFFSWIWLELIGKVVITLNGTVGARLHISFPVLNRSSFGFWFSYFTVISRVVLAMFWFGIQVLFSPFRHSNHWWICRHTQVLSASIRC